MVCKLDEAVSQVDARIRGMASCVHQVNADIRTNVEPGASQQKAYSILRRATTHLEPVDP